MQADFLLLGGDARQTALAGLLRREHTVQTLGVPGCEDEAAPGARRIVLPIPSLARDGALRPLPEGALPLLKQAERIYGGGLGGRTLPGLALTDLLEDTLAVAENARLTAEAALVLVMQHTRESLAGRRCAVLGFGRIGQVLCRLLAGIGARPLVCSARAAQRALAAALGWESAAPEALAACAPDYVFNTAPARLVPDETLAALPPDCLWIELASGAGGLPQGAAPAFAVLPGNGLPGRLLPVSAAAVLHRAILRTL